MSERVINELNKFLTGIHMGGATFKDYRNKAQDEELKYELEMIIASFKRHEEAITNRISDLGGNASDSLGIIGEMAELWEKIKLISVDSDLEVCKHAIKAMEMGMENANKFIKENENMEEYIMNDVKGVVKDYDDHLMKIKEIENKFKK